MSNQVRLLLATSNCIAICESSGDDWRVVQRDLMGNYATSVIAQQAQVLLGTRNGIFRSDDMGDSWRLVNNGLTIHHIRWIVGHPDSPGLIFAGSEPAGIFLSTDGGSSWRGTPEVEALREEQRWYLPYSPEAGCVRGFAFSGRRAYAAVEVGGTLVSDDGGQSWELSTPPTSPAGRIHPDLHSVETHPSSGEMIVAPTGGGFYVSDDGGVNWVNHYPSSYCRAVWWDPEDINHMLLGSADWVNRNGRVEESRDGGFSWQPASDGLDVPWGKYMVERFTQVGNELLAVLSNGEVWSSNLEDISWHRILPEVRDVKAAGAILIAD